MVDTLQIPLLATIPMSSDLRAYHQLASQMQFFLNQKKMQAFLFTAPDIDQGNTTVVSNLGVCLAKDFKKRVLIIDAHYHQAGIHRKFDHSVGPGLVEVLSGKLGFLKACREIVPNLSILSAGDAQLDSESLLDLQKMADLLLEAKAAFEIVLIDCADMRHYRDAISLGSLVDAIVLVVAEGKTRRPAISVATAALRENNFVVVGSVLNRRTFALPKFIYDRV